MGLFSKKNKLVKSGKVSRINFISGWGEPTEPAYVVLMLQGDPTLYSYSYWNYSEAKSVFITRDTDEVEFSIYEGHTEIVTDSYVNKTLSSS